MVWVEGRLSASEGLSETCTVTETAHMMNDLTPTKIMTGSARASGNSRSTMNVLEKLFHS